MHVTWAWVFGYLYRMLLAAPELGTALLGCVRVRQEGQLARACAELWRSREDSHRHALFLRCARRHRCKNAPNTIGEDVDGAPGALIELTATR